MYMCLTLKTKTDVATGAGRKVKTEVKSTPILVPIGASTTFFQNTAGDTKVRIHDTEYEIVESLKEVCDLITQSLLVANLEALNKFFPSGEGDV
jgi:hypothetical protein